MFAFLTEFYAPQIAEIQACFPGAQFITINDRNFGAFDNITQAHIGFNNETQTWGLMIDCNTPVGPAKTLKELLPR